MADGRMLKRVISTSPRLAALKNDTHRLIYTWLIPFLDVEGRHEADARIIKGHVTPLLDHVTTKIIDAALRDMAANDLIILYQVNGFKYLELLRFKKHQTLREGREKQSDIPPPTDGVPTDNTSTTDGVPTDNRRLTAQQDKIREVKRREEKAAPDRVRHLDSVFLSQNEYKKLQEAIGQKSLDFGIEKLDYSITVKGGKYKDHYKTLLNWFNRGYLSGQGDNGNKPIDSPKEPIYKICPKCGKESQASDVFKNDCIRCAPRPPLEKIRALTRGIRLVPEPLPEGDP